MLCIQFCSLEYHFWTVPVELGSRYTDNNWTQKLMTLNEFIDNHVTLNVSSNYCFIIVVAINVYLRRREEILVP